MNNLHITIIDDYGIKTDYYIINESKGGEVKKLYNFIEIIQKDLSERYIISNETDLSFDDLKNEIQKENPNRDLKIIVY